jgi:hypothetical protein
MWICPLCKQTFLKNNQSHACNEMQVEDFLRGKSDHTLSLFQHFTEHVSQIAQIKLNTTKTMISIECEGKEYLYFPTWQELSPCCFYFQTIVS